MWQRLLGLLLRQQGPSNRLDWFSSGLGAEGLSRYLTVEAEHAPLGHMLKNDRFQLGPY
jgi:hypothetical protein